MTNPTDEFFEEIKDVTEEVTIVLRKHSCPSLADKLLLAMGRMEGVIKFHGMDVETKESFNSLPETL